MSDEITRPSLPASVRATMQVILRAKAPRTGLQPEFIITQFPATIGRHPANDIELPFDSVSRYQARIEIHEGLLQLVDLRSANGTFVNGRRVEIAPITDHDAIAFGNLEFALVLNGPAPEAKPEHLPGEQTSVHFMVKDDHVQTIFHTEMTENSRVEALDEEITDSAHLRKAKQRLISLYKLEEVLRSTTDEEKLLRGVLKLLFDVLPVDRGVILTRDERDPTVFRPIAIKVKRGAAHDGIGISRTILQRCMREKVALLTRDATSDSRFKASESVVANQMRSVMCVPLISDRHVFGFCHLDTADAVRSFTEEDLSFLAHVGQEVAIHLHNLHMLQEKIVSERMAAIGQTITGMAHSIKNILVLSQGGFEMMEKRLHAKNYEALDETWGLVRRGLDRINGLVKDMLDYSRARAMHKRKVKVNELVDELSRTFGDEMAKRGITCELDLEDACPTLMLDADGLDKSLVNLIVNAMEACGETTGRIILRTRRTAEGDLAIQIEDNAGGIPAEVLPRIFVPFFTTKGSKGSGLGLAMTKKIIEDMGGRLEVQSTEGVGTCFTITLYVGPPAPKLGQVADQAHTVDE